MNTHLTKPGFDFTVEVLAVKFSEAVRERLTPEELQLVIRRNATSHEASVCATQDFCDANQLMIDSFEDIANRQVYLPSDVEEAFCTQEQVDADRAMTELAWKLAREVEFDPNQVAKQALTSRDDAVLREAVDAALDAGCAVIQSYLGVTTGDFAGVHFSGPSDGLTSLLRDYLDAQRAHIERT